MFMLTNTCKKHVQPCITGDCVMLSRTVKQMMMTATSNVARMDLEMVLLAVPTASGRNMCDIPGMTCGQADTPATILKQSDGCVILLMLLAHASILCTCTTVHCLEIQLCRVYQFSIFPDHISLSDDLRSSIQCSASLSALQSSVHWTWPN